MLHLGEEPPRTGDGRVEHRESGLIGMVVAKRTRHDHRRVARLDLRANPRNRRPRLVQSEPREPLVGKLEPADARGREAETVESSNRFATALRAEPAAIR